MALLAQDSIPAPKKNSTYRTTVPRTFSISRRKLFSRKLKIARTKFTEKKLGGKHQEEFFWSDAGRRGGLGTEGSHGWDGQVGCACRKLGGIAQATERMNTPACPALTFELGNWATLAQWV